MQMDTDTGRYTRYGIVCLRCEALTRAAAESQFKKWLYANRKTRVGIIPTSIQDIMSILMEPIPAGTVKKKKKKKQSQAAAPPNDDDGDTAVDDDDPDGDQKAATAAGISVSSRRSPTRAEQTLTLLQRQSSLVGEQSAAAVAARTLARAKRKYAANLFG